MPVQHEYNKQLAIRVLKYITGKQILLEIWLNCSLKLSDSEVYWNSCLKSFTCPEEDIVNTLAIWPNEVNEDMNKPCCLSEAQLDVTAPMVGMHAAKLMP